MRGRKAGAGRAPHAAQHKQTPDPAAAITRLRALLLSRDAPMPGLDRAQSARAQAELEAALDRILALLQQLPRRLVD